MYKSKIRHTIEYKILSGSYIKQYIFLFIFEKLWTVKKEGNSIQNTRKAFKRIYNFLISTNILNVIF